MIDDFSLIILQSNNLVSLLSKRITQRFFRITAEIRNRIKTISFS